MRYVFMIVLGWAVLIPQDSFAACTLPAAPAGSMQWFPGDLRLKYCGGTVWRSMAHVNTGAACTVAGQLLFRTSEMHYCSGGFWRTTAPVVNHSTCVAGLAGKFYYDPGNTYYWYCTGATWRRMLDI